MVETFGDDTRMLKYMMILQNRLWNPIGLLYGSFIVIVFILYIAQASVLRLIFFIIYKSMRYCCACYFKKSDEVNIVRGELQKERDCRGIDAWSECFFKEQQIEPMKDLYDRFIIEIKIAEDIQKSDKSDSKRYDHVIKQMRDRQQAISKRVDVYIVKLCEICEYKKEKGFDLLSLTQDEKFEILILNEIKLLQYYDYQKKLKSREFEEEWKVMRLTGVTLSYYMYDA